MRGRSRETSDEPIGRARRSARGLRSGLRTAARARPSAIAESSEQIMQLRRWGRFPNSATDDAIEQQHVERRRHEQPAARGFFSDATPLRGRSVQEIRVCRAFGQLDDGCELGK